MLIDTNICLPSKIDKPTVIHEHRANILFQINEISQQAVQKMIFKIENNFNIRKTTQKRQNPSLSKTT